MKKIGLVVVFLSITLYAFGQSDYRRAYIVINPYDTTFGYAKFKEGNSNYDFCEFKEKIDGKSEKFFPSQILSYRFIDDQYFETKNILHDNEVKSTFLEVLVRGRITLYKNQSSFYVEKGDSIFYQLNNEEQKVRIGGDLYLKQSNHHIGMLNLLLFDCKDTHNLGRKIRLTEQYLTKLIEKYNACFNGSSISFKSKKPWIKMTYGLGIGFRSSSLKINKTGASFAHLNSNYSKSTTPTFGALIGVNSPRVHEKISFYLELYYLSSIYNTENSSDSSNTVTRNDVVIWLKELKIPFGVQYTFIERKFSPYILLGINSSITISSSTNWVQEVENNNVVNTYRQEAVDISETQQGLFVSAGVSKALFSGLFSDLELRYELSNRFIKNDVFLDSSLNSIQLLLRVRF